MSRALRPWGRSLLSHHDRGGSDCRGTREVEAEFVDMVTVARRLDSSQWKFRLRGRVSHPLKEGPGPCFGWVAWVSTRLGGAPLGRLRRGVGLREDNRDADQRDPAAGTQERGGTDRAATAAAGRPGQEAGRVLGRGDGRARGTRRTDRRRRTAGGNRTEGAGVQRAEPGGGKRVV